MLCPLLHDKGSLADLLLAVSILHLLQAQWRSQQASRHLDWHIHLVSSRHALICHSCFTTIVAFCTYMSG